MKSIFVCQSCGFESPKWAGKCPGCSGWNSFVETAVSPNKSRGKGQKAKVQVKGQNLSQVSAASHQRLVTGISEFDRVLGGGIVPGSVILLVGEPGIGKSTLLLQIADSLDKVDKVLDLARSRTLYISGEESAEQIKLRADRLGVKAENIEVLAETDVDAIVSVSSSPSGPSCPSLLIVDSIQTLTTSDLASPAGSVSQVRECASRLIYLAKTSRIAVIISGHVTKEGDIAGPKVLEHLVDTVLSLEGDRFHAARLLRATKNRFGGATEVGVFTMEEGGLKEVVNPSGLFLSERPTRSSGSVVTVAMEGSRPVLLEIQALTSPTALPYPRRTAEGFNINRLNLLLAVLQKKLRLNLQNQDVYLNVAGGFKVSEPAVDLAAVLAVVSSLKDSPVAADVCVFGEVGLAGEVRKVAQMERRIKEARKLGFTKVVSPDSVKLASEALTMLGF